MKKIVLCGLLAVLCSGCGRGWLPLRGAPCGHACRQQLPAPPMADPCAACGPATASASYAPYDETIIGGGEYYSGQVLSNEYYPGAISNGTVIDNTPMMVPANPGAAQ